MSLVMRLGIEVSHRCLLGVFLSIQVLWSFYLCKCLTDVLTCNFFIAFFGSVFMRCIDLSVLLGIFFFWFSLPIGAGRQEPTMSCSNRRDFLDHFLCDYDDFTIMGEHLFFEDCCRTSVINYSLLKV